jgi:hypothetical protein
MLSASMKFMNKKKLWDGILAYKANGVPLHAMEALGWRGGVAPIHSGPQHWMGGGWVVSVTPQPHFSPRERTPDTRCTGGWVGPRAGLDVEVRGKILLSLPAIKLRSLGSPARSQTLYRLSYPAHILAYTGPFLALVWMCNFCTFIQIQTLWKARFYYICLTLY